MNHLLSPAIPWQQPRVRVYGRLHPVLVGQSLRAFSRELGISPMTVSRHEKAALVALREQLA